jgi:magnesium transporter
MGIGLLTGTMCGLVMALISLVWFGNSQLALITSISMVGNQVIAGFVGTTVPIMLRKMQMDPALGSSILVTMATDTGGFFILLSLSALFLRYIVG